EQRLEMEDVDEPRLDELRLGNRRDHPEQGLVRKNERSLGHGVHVSGEAQRAQVLDVRGLERHRARQVLELPFIEAQRLEVVERLREPCRDQERAPRGQPPNEELERGRRVHPPREVRAEHRQLVQIREERLVAHDGSGASGPSESTVAPSSFISAIARAPSPGWTSTGRTADSSSTTS